MQIGRQTALLDGTVMQLAGQRVIDIERNTYALATEYAHGDSAEEGCNPEHPLAQLDNVTFDDLHVHRRLAFSAHASKLPSSEYLRSTQLWQAESYLALLEMVRAGLGWATLPRQLVQRELAKGELVELQLSAYPHTDWQIGVDLLWARQRPLGKAERWLKEKLQGNKVYELDRNGQITTL